MTTFLNNYTNASASTTTVLTTTLDFGTWVLATFEHYSMAYFSLPLQPIGIIFNSLIILVFTKSPSGTTKTTRIYYLAIAVGDIVILILKDFFLFTFANGLYYIGLIPTSVYRWPNENVMICRSFVFIWISTEIFVNMTYVVLDTERFIALYFPFKARSLITKRKVVGLLCVIGVCGVVIASFLFRSLDLVRDPYAVHQVFCSVSPSLDLLLTVTSTLFILVDDVIPTLMCFFLSALIALKIFKILSKKHAVEATDERGMTNKQIEYFVTPLIVSFLHVCFYLPLSIFRLAVIILPYVSEIDVTKAYFLLGMGFTLYTYVIPVRLMNFIIYMRRIPEFNKNAKLAMKCRRNQIVASSTSD